jgi:hypothetical protein
VIAASVIVLKTVAGMLEKHHLNVPEKNIKPVALAALITPIGNSVFASVYKKK